MVNKNSSILNNDFYIFILILLLIIMLFMLSPKNKDSFNLDISKIKLNIKEPFEFEFTGDHFKFDVDVDNDNLHLILSRYMDNLPPIKENDIIKKFYIDPAHKTHKNNFHFHIKNVEYLTNKNYKLKIPVIDAKKQADINKQHELLSKKSYIKYKVIVVGNTNENCILATDLEFETNDSDAEVDYNLKFTNIQEEFKDFKDLIKIFNEGDVIELIPSDNKVTVELTNNNNKFLINKIDEKTKTLKLNSSETIATTDADGKDINILVDKEFLIKKVDLNDIVEKYHNDQKTHYTEHLRIKNEAINLGIMVDRIKEQMNRNK